MVQISSLMEVFSGGMLEYRVMERSGCLNYATTAWETVKLGVFERSVSYKFNRHVSIFGGEVSCTQQKKSNEDGWTVNEVMLLHNVPFGDHFRVRSRTNFMFSPNQVRSITFSNPGVSFSGPSKVPDCEISSDS